MLKPEQIIRAWKDEAYRLSLSEAERAMLPENPAGSVELSDAQLGNVSGGAAARPTLICTHPVFCGTPLCPTNFTCGGICGPINKASL
jgi:mersacidin/lichenicidin family type 2 lantibiotic